MDEAAQWRRLRCGGENGEDAADLAVFVCRKRRSGRGWGGGSSGRMAEAAQRWRLWYGGRNGDDMAVVAVVVWRKRCDRAV